MEDTTNECEHEWQYNYDCFEDARIFEMDTLGIPVKCSKCDVEGIEWWVFSRVTESD